MTALVKGSQMQDEARFTLRPAEVRQTIKGIGFEIQSDSIGSGNNGLPEAPIAVPHDLIASERDRLATEMLRGFRYCRLAGGLYFRGLDSEQKYLQPRWPEQLQELDRLLDLAGVEGVSLEYWSPAPFWKGSRSYVGSKPNDPANTLRCFAPGFDQDPDYKGDVDAFLADFAKAVVRDIETLKAAGIRTSMFGLQNEPEVNHTIYSTCFYRTPEQYTKAFRAVARAIRSNDPGIMIFADTGHHFPKFIGPSMNDPEIASLVDAYAVHMVGSPSDTPVKVHAEITAKLPPKPWFQNEYEYQSATSPGRCLNTVNHIMNSFQIGQNPTWFWLHALKPLKNAEASGYCLGFWKSQIEAPLTASAQQQRRWIEGPEFTSLPEPLRDLEMVSGQRPANNKTPVAYYFTVNQPVTVYLLAEDCEGLKLDAAWERTDLVSTWPDGRDVIFKQTFQKGQVKVPAPTGRSGDRPSVPHQAFIEPSDPKTFHVQVGTNLPMQIRSQAIALEKRAEAIKPGHWVFNEYNWHAVGSFVRHMPWDCQAIAVEEEQAYNSLARVLAFKRPNGKLTVVVSNASESDPRRFAITTGLPDGTWKGFRYTPHEAGEGTMGVPCGTLTGEVIRPELPPRSWEFWEQE